MTNSNTSPTMLNVVVLAGGPSAEAEVSHRSAAQVHAALQDLGHASQVVELDGNCLGTLLKIRPDVVFPALHGPPGEDGTVQGALEILGVSYVGSDVRGSALAMDKAVAKSIFRRHGLPVSDDRVVTQGIELNDVITDIERSLGRQVAIKPLNAGSAIGVQLLPQGGDLASALAQSLQYGDCLVEPFIVGKEITVGVLHTKDSLQAHPVIEIRTAQDQWYDYQNRYTEGSSEHIIPADLAPAVLADLQRIAVHAHTALGLRDLSRADFIVSADEQITLLEVNTLPGMTPTSLYPDGAAALGYDFAALVDLLVRAAFARGAN
ncbi:MAG: D-alanine--D-alanine ligase [Pseudomonadota bacterium]|nr:D-alanine--D-alanine ligase [Pseudomonadota bacterium]